ncbi:hypothetical protein H2200_008369 [Cladophialophora chaetospira]|uniref:Uncharacterized protein n=1 Tax=Cladophialophora chaetospira TaxID=386627 RepID=A0AA38X647_9EURO|nr:hypothetical protein H2200_008369 [Cladophialophora chaetospira]
MAAIELAFVDSTPRQNSDRFCASSRNSQYSKPDKQHILAKSDGPLFFDGFRPGDFQPGREIFSGELKNDALAAERDLLKCPREDRLAAKGEQEKMKKEWKKAEAERKKKRKKELKQGDSDGDA